MQLEQAFRDDRMNTYLIARQQEVSDLHTIANLQGAVDQKYTVSIQFSQQPRRAKMALAWPSSPAENMERLAEAGFPIDSLKVKCMNCNGIGHVAKHCSEEKVEKAKTVITCANCNSEGHYARDCTEERKSGKKGCRNCGEEDHMARDCPNKPAETCHRCGEEGESLDVRDRGPNGGSY